MRGPRRALRAGGGAALLLLAVSPEGAKAQGAQPDGARLFAENCSACHQPTGLGIKGAFPALKGDAVALGSPPAVAAVVLNGRGGMPAFGPELDDQTIAAILTFVRSAWGNAAPPVQTAVVAGVRSGTAPSVHEGSMQAH